MVHQSGSASACVIIASESLDAMHPKASGAMSSAGGLRLNRHV